MFTGVQEARHEVSNPLKIQLCAVRRGRGGEGDGGGDCICHEVIRL